MTDSSTKEKNIKEEREIIFKKYTTGGKGDNISIRGILHNNGIIFSP